MIHNDDIDSRAARLAGAALFDSCDDLKSETIGGQQLSLAENGWSKALRTHIIAKYDKTALTFQESPEEYIIFKGLEMRICYKNRKQNNSYFLITLGDSWNQMYVRNWEELVEGGKYNRPLAWMLEYSDISKEALEVAKANPYVKMPIGLRYDKILKDYKDGEISISKYKDDKEIVLEFLMQEKEAIECRHLENGLKTES